MNKDVKIYDMNGELLEEYDRIDIKGLEDFAPMLVVEKGEWYIGSPFYEKTFSITSQKVEPYKDGYRFIKYTKF